MALTLFSDPVLSDMEKMLTSSFGYPTFSLARPRSAAAAPAGSVNLAMDIIETPTAFELHADAPGMSADDIKVELHEGVLTVSGQRKISRDDKDPSGKVWRSERSSYSFSRSFTLPDTANGEAISASLDKGVLAVSVPKREQPPKPEPKRIAVQQGA